MLLGTQLPLPKTGAEPPIFGRVYCGQTAGWIKMPLGVEVGLGSGHIVLDGDPALPPPKVHSPPIFGPCLLWPNGWKVEGLEKHLGLGLARSRSRSRLVAKIRRLKNRMSRSRLGLVSQGLVYIPENKQVMLVGE